MALAKGLTGAEKALWPHIWTASVNKELVETGLCKNPRARTAVFEVLAPTGHSTGHTLLDFKTVMDQKEERHNSTLVCIQLGNLRLRVNQMQGVMISNSHNRLAHDIIAQL
jgi:hypothetical protein